MKKLKILTLKQCLLCLALGLLLLSCKKEQSTIQQPRLGTSELTDISELGTVEYVITKMVKADDNADWYEFGDRKILFSCKASLKAGIDMSNFNDSNIEVDTLEKSIKVTFLNATLLSCNMKPEDITLVYEKNAITRSKFSNAERDIIMAQGEKSILDDVPNYGILKDAERNASAFAKAMLTQAGFENIIINFSNSSK